MLTLSGVDKQTKQFSNVLNRAAEIDALAKKVKKTYKMSLAALCEMHINDDLYSENRVAYVSESGLYQLIFSSRLEFADKPRACHLMHGPVPYLNRSIQNWSS